MSRLLRRCATTLLAVGLVAGVVSVASPFPPRERQLSTEVRVNHWPKPCTAFILGGDELPPVKFELGLPLTEWPDPMYLEFGLSRARFDSRVRAKLAWMWEDSSTDRYETAGYRAAARAEHEGILQPVRLAALFERYRAAEVRTRNADVAHVVFWCAGVIIPPLVLLGIGRALRMRRASSKM